MFDFASIAKSVLSFAEAHLPALKGAPEAVQTVKAIGGLISSVKHFADAPTRAELDKLEAQTFAEIDSAIDSLGDRPER
jgi:hypothetical protein